MSGDQNIPAPRSSATKAERTARLHAMWDAEDEKLRQEHAEDMSAMTPEQRAARAAEAIRKFGGAA